MPWQLVYTSAPSGLIPGRSGFCTVARDADMRERLAQELERVSACESTALPEGQALFTFRRILIGLDAFGVVTRACRAGIDYTQRANMLAHHLVFTAQEMAFLGDSITPAEVALLWPKWLDRWEGPPRFFDAAQKIYLQEIRTLRQRFPLPARTWQTLSGDAGNAAFMTGSGSVFFSGDTLPCETILKLWAEGASLLESPDIWRTEWATHWIPNDFTPRWAAHTGPKAPSASARILDPTRPPPLPSDLAGPAAVARTGKPPAASKAVATATAPRFYPNVSAPPESSGKWIWLGSLLSIVLICAVLIGFVLLSPDHEHNAVLPPPPPNTALPPLDLRAHRVVAPESPPSPTAAPGLSPSLAPALKAPSTAVAAPATRPFDIAPFAAYVNYPAEASRETFIQLHRRIRAFCADLPDVRSLQPTQPSYWTYLFNWLAPLPHEPALLIPSHWQTTLTCDDFTQENADFKAPAAFRACFGDTPPAVAAAAADTLAVPDSFTAFDIRPREDYEKGLSLVLRDFARSPQSGFLFQLDFPDKDTARLTRRLFRPDSLLWSQPQNAPARALQGNVALRFAKDNVDFLLVAVDRPAAWQPLALALDFAPGHSALVAQGDQIRFAPHVAPTLNFISLPPPYVFELSDALGLFHARADSVAALVASRRAAVEGLSAALAQLREKIARLPDKNPEADAARATLEKELQFTQDLKQRLESPHWAVRLAPWSLRAVAPDSAAKPLDLLKFTSPLSAPHER